MAKEKVTIYRILEGKTVFPVVPLGVKRKWMTDSYYKFAYSCLPLNIANQYGFAVLSPVDFTLDWWGGMEGKDVDFDIDCEDKAFYHYIKGHFGEGTFTIHPDFFLRTPEGYSTYIRGIPNETRKGIKPLDAIVETDWLTFTFTYNFLLNEPGVYSFKKGEPLFCFFPIKRNTVENFELNEQRLDDHPEVKESFDNYDNLRKSYVLTNTKPKFQKFYRNGVDPFGNKLTIKDHITSLIFGKKQNKLNNKEIAEEE